MDEKVTSLIGKFQRDINRLSDNDRNTRKRGLQKLLEELPWTTKSQQETLEKAVCATMISPLLVTISDTIEKCRELTLTMLKNIVGVCRSISTFSDQLVFELCNRISDVPFAEPSEELRLQIVLLLGDIIKHPSVVSHKDASKIFHPIMGALNKALTDSFPSVKKELADLISLISKISDVCVKSSCKYFIKNLTSNALHQHSKVRTATLKAIGNCLACASAEDYNLCMKEHVLALVVKEVADRTAGKIIATFISSVQHELS